MGRIVAGEPDFIDAVIESDNAIEGHDLAHVGNQALGVDREAGVVGAVEKASSTCFRTTLNRAKSQLSCTSTFSLIRQMLLAISPTTSSWGK